MDPRLPPMDGGNARNGGAHLGGPPGGPALEGSLGGRQIQQKPYSDPALRSIHGFFSNWLNRAYGRENDIFGDSKKTYVAVMQEVLEDVLTREDNGTVPDRADIPRVFCNVMRGLAKEHHVAPNDVKFAQMLKSASQELTTNYQMAQPNFGAVHDQGMELQRAESKQIFKEVVEWLDLTYPYARVSSIPMSFNREVEKKLIQLLYQVLIDF